jgi:NADPH:quinone reductase-like Zn-dependent oxidoreductase
MRAAAIEQFGGPEVLQVMDLPEPQAGPGEVLIAVKGAGMGPWDWKMRGSSEAAGNPKLPYILGFEGAGVVTATGDGVADLDVGDEVYTYKWPGGCFAEFVAAPASATGRKPASLTFDEAAAVPVAGLTAHQGVVDELAMKPGETLLITGAAGGVGTFAVQIAAHEAVRVVAQVSAENADYVSELGAAEWVDYRDDGWVGAAREKADGNGVDAVLDLVGGQTFAQSMRALRPGGRAAGIAGQPEAVPDGVSAHFYVGKAETSRLEALAKLFDAGTLETHIERVLPLEEIHAGLDEVERGHMRGKLVLHVRD